MEDILRYDGLALCPIRSLNDSDNFVVYCDSFTLQFFPGIKVGSIVVPKNLSRAFSGAKLLTDRSGSPQTQSVLSEFLASVFYDRHIRKLRATFKTSFETINGELTKNLLGYGSISNTVCGSHITFNLNGFTDREVLKAFNKLGFSARALSSFSPQPHHVCNGLMLGFGTYTSSEISSAIKGLRSVLDKMNSRK